MCVCVRVIVCVCVCVSVRFMMSQILLRWDSSVLLLWERKASARRVPIDRLSTAVADLLACGGLVPFLCTTNMEGNVFSLRVCSVVVCVWLPGLRHP